MKHVRNIICIGLAVVMLLASTSTVNAANHVGGCESDLYRVQCGGLVGSNISIGSHVVGYDLNYNPVYCSMTAEKHFHTIFCSGCSVVLKANDVRNCMEIHTICGVKTNTCQY